MSTPDLSRPAAPECFALLDDCTASTADPRSRLYTGHVGTVTCHEADALCDLLDRTRDAQLQGQHALILLSYELGAQLQAIAPRSAGSAWAQVLLFEHCQHLATDEVDAWLAAADPVSETSDIAAAAGQDGICNLQEGISPKNFEGAIADIKKYIEAGDTYQLNFTYRMRFDAYGSPRQLYRRLRARQPVPYGALIALPDGRTVLSLSPELFLRHHRGQLTAQPMKGTAPASADRSLNLKRAAALAADPKNRAENLMIVDLLRNDLGRVAGTGTVRVPHLFNVSLHGDVLQMTSTVQARLRQALPLHELIAALYPCGSISGAPKRRTMQIIRELEPDPRGIYTGAIGWVDAPGDGQSFGDFCLSVPIRTLMLDAPGANGLRSGEMGVGAGITYDSNAADEYAECRLKAQFLTGLTQEFELFETMHATRDEGCRHAELHLQRLRTSAMVFGFQYDENAVLEYLLNACASLPAEGSHRMRLALKHSGTLHLQHAPLAPLATPVRLWLAPLPTEATDLFLQHKTTLRARYDAAWRAAEAQGVFDVLFFNTRGELTEGARSNVFVKLKGRWLTPPLDAGVLPGVMRSVLLADSKWHAREQRLTLDDLYAAEEIMVCNALRGALPARLDQEGGTLQADVADT